MNSNKQLLTRMGISIIVFVLVAVSYVNFTNNRDQELKKDIQPVEEIVDKAYALEPEEEYMIEDDGAVLGEVDIESLPDESN